MCKLNGYLSSICLSVCLSVSLSLTDSLTQEMPSEEDIRDIVTEFHVLQHVGAHNNIVALIGASDFKGTHTHT